MILAKFQSINKRRLLIDSIIGLRLVRKIAISLRKRKVFIENRKMWNEIALE
jgi:hypothetical protein